MNKVENAVAVTKRRMKLLDKIDISCFAYSPVTGEEFSVNPSDYFWLGEDEVLTDSEGNETYFFQRFTQLIAVQL